jgi:hypothetical protein
MLDSRINKSGTNCFWMRGFSWYARTEASRLSDSFCFGRSRPAVLCHVAFSGRLAVCDYRCCQSSTHSDSAQAVEMPERAAECETLTSNQNFVRTVLLISDRNNDKLSRKADTLSEIACSTPLECTRSRELGCDSNSRSSCARR